MPGLGVGVGDVAVEGMVVGTTHSFAICDSATVGKTTDVGGLVVTVGGPTVAVGPPVAVGVAGAGGMTLTNRSMPSTGYTALTVTPLKILSVCATSSRIRAVPVFRLTRTEID